MGVFIPAGLAIGARGLAAAKKIVQIRKKMRRMSSSTSGSPKRKAKENQALAIKNILNPFKGLGSKILNKANQLERKTSQGRNKATGGKK